MAFSTTDQDSFWQALSGSAFWRVVLAIFLTFSAVGFVQDVLNGGTTPALRHGLNVIGAGLIAVAWFIVVVKYRAWIGALVVAQIVGLLLGPRLLPAAPALKDVPIEMIHHRLVLDGIGCLVAIVGGYAFFISVIATEGVRHFRLDAEVGLAHQIHAVLVPALTGRHAGVEYYGTSKPSSEMGGDLIDVVTPEGALVAYIADVSGHGVAAGLLMGMTKSAARMKLAAGAEVATFLGALNNVISDVKKPDMFVTCGCLRLFADGRVEYASAGHLPVLHYRRAVQRVEEWLSPGFPLGLVRGTAYDTVTRRVAPGDLLVCVTDGLTEVFDANDAEFGLDGLATLIEKHHDRPLPEIVAELEAAVARHGAALDDQTVLLLRITG